ncbi:MAG: hypothetical protein LBU41_04140 [Clostridiales Family XIII bacterium]|jgi:hypothetical protein|nr:hypothetical protein [Clostridiales Family XIII bacterium]
MKKLSLLFLSLMLMIVLVACGSKTDSDKSTTSPPTSQSETEDPSDSADISGTEEYPYLTPIIPDDLSPNPDSFQISLDGNVLTLPALYSDFVALGWESEDIDDQTLKPGFMTIGNTSLDKGDARLAGANFINLGDKEAPLSECHVYGVSFIYSKWNALGTSFVLPGGLHVASTLDEIIAAYGEPTERDDSVARTTKLTYRFDEDKYIRFEIDNEYAPFGNQIAIYTA